MSFASVGSPKHEVHYVGLLKKLFQLKELVISSFGEEITLGVMGGVEEINNKVEHGREKVAEGGNTGWDIFHWYQGIGRCVSIMVHWRFIEARDEYAK